MIKLLGDFSHFFNIKFDKNNLYNIFRDTQEFLPAYVFMKELYDRGFYRADDVINIENSFLGYYYKPEASYYTKRIKNYNAVIECFMDCKGQEMLYFNISEDTYEILVGPGYIIDSAGNILCMLAGKYNGDSFDLNVIYNEVENDVVKENVVLFISTEFIQNPIYKNIYKKFYSTFVMEGAISKGIEVRFLPCEKITDLLYPEIQYIPNNFNTPEEKIAYVESLSVPDILNMSVSTATSENLLSIFQELDEIFPT